VWCDRGGHSDGIMSVRIGFLNVYCGISGEAGDVVEVMDRLGVGGLSNFGSGCELEGRASNQNRYY
jgi:hypothetical protein